MSNAATPSPVHIPGFFTYEASGTPFTVLLSLDTVVDLSQEVMRGFGAVPKRGAEVGGLLLGKIEASGDRSVITIDGFEPVPIEYRRGPSYLLSETDLQAFEDAKKRSQREAIGIYRSFTRDTAGLGEEDIVLMNRFFPEASAPVLWIRPYATRIPEAAFLFRANGAFPPGDPAITFPFRRRDLDPNAPPPPEPGAPRVRERRRESLDALVLGEAGSTEPAPAAVPRTTVTPAVVPAIDLPQISLKPRRRTWLWIPLSILLLAAGGAAGFYGGITSRPAAPPIPDAYAMGLHITQNGNDLHVQWDRQSAAIQKARRGVLAINDGVYTKSVSLDADHLQTGSVVYRYSSGDVRFRLEVYPREHTTVAQDVEWRGAPASPEPASPSPEQLPSKQP